MSVALLSRAKKSECGIAQPSSSITVYNVLTDSTPEPLPKTRASTNAIIVKIWDRQTHTQTDTHTHEGVCRVAPQLTNALKHNKDINDEHDDILYNDHIT